MRRVILIVVLMCSAITVAADNPQSIPCDVHPGLTFYKNGREYPRGECFDVYQHSYSDSNCMCTRTHRALLKCQP